MRILVSGGGTGGHVYPILAVIDALRRAAASPANSTVNGAAVHALCYAGTPDGVEAELARQAGLEFAAIRAGQMRIANPLKLARNGLWLLQGAWQAQRLVHSWQPDVVFVTGGYACAPVVWAAHRQRVPVLIYLPDMTPGLAVQRLAAYATQVAVTFPAAAEYFPGKAIVTGYPVRAELAQRTRSKAAARATFDLDPKRTTLLIFGGSRGSRSINQATAAILPDLLADVQLIHITGELDWPAAQERVTHLALEHKHAYRPFAYLHHEMIDALCAADLVVARAGASTLGEFPVLGLPAILIPLPISGQHQLPNARYLADRGAALIVEDEHMTTQLLPAIRSVLHDPDRLAAMSRASAALAAPMAAQRLAEALLRLGEKTSAGENLSLPLTHA